MKKSSIIVLIVFVAIVTLGVVVYIMSVKNEEGRDIEEKIKIIDVLETLINNSKTESISLSAIDGSNSTGVAYRLFADGKFNHLVVAEMPDPAVGSFYEGWLVQDDPFAFFSTGTMEKNDNDQWMLVYLSNENFPNYSQVVITEETVIDSTPEKHILEGTF